MICEQWKRFIDLVQLENANIYIFRILAFDASEKSIGCDFIPEKFYFFFLTKTIFSATMCESLMAENMACAKLNRRKSDAPSNGARENTIIVTLLERQKTPRCNQKIYSVRISYHNVVFTLKMLVHGAQHTVRSFRTCSTDAPCAWIWCMRWVPVQIKNRLQSRKAHRSRKFISSTGWFFLSVSFSHFVPRSLGGPSLPAFSRYCLVCAEASLVFRFSVCWSFYDSWFCANDLECAFHSATGKLSESRKLHEILVPVAGAFDSDKKRLKIFAVATDLHHDGFWRQPKQWKQQKKKTVGCILWFRSTCSVCTHEYMTRHSDAEIYVQNIFLCAMHKIGASNFHSATV